MFIVASYKNVRGKKNCEPFGTAFAISEEFILTACHNVFPTKNALTPVRTVALLKEVTNAAVFSGDIIVAELEGFCKDKDEDWAVYKRKSGRFTHYAHVCNENELPSKNVRIGIRDFPIGLLIANSSTKITIESCHTKVSHYEEFQKTSSQPPTKKAKLILPVVDYPTIPSSDERIIQVIGGRVKGSCGAGYFAPNNKIVAFHYESVDHGEELSITNSYTSDRSHTSYSHGLVLCRLPKFKVWYNKEIADALGIAAI